MNKTTRQGEIAADKVLTHVLLCEFFVQGDIKDRGQLRSDLMKRVRQNQDERYHRFDSGPSDGTAEDTGLPEAYVDFKLVFSMPIDFLYAQLRSGSAVPKAIIPQPYLQGFIHRLYGFLGRVAVPE